MLGIRKDTRDKCVNMQVIPRKIAIRRISKFDIYMTLFAILSAGIYVYTLAHDVDTAFFIGFESIAFIILALYSKGSCYIVNLSFLSLLSIFEIVLFLYSNSLSLCLKTIVEYLFLGVLPSMIVYLYRIKFKVHYNSLNSSESSEGMIIDTIVETVSIIDHQGNIVYINRGFENIKNIFSAVAGVDIKRGDNVFQVVKRVNFANPVIYDEVYSGIKDVVTGERDSFFYEFYFDDDNNRRWFLLTFEPIRNRSGEIMASITDITYRKKIEEELRESKRKYRRLLSSLPDSVLIIIGDRIVYANQMCLSMFGFSNIEEITGRSIFEFIHGDFHKIAADRIDAIQNRLEEVPLTEEKIVTRDGTIIDVEVSSILYYYDEIPSSLVVLRDITKRKQAESLKKDVEIREKLLQEAYEYDRLKDEFIANVSHELRTPINVILSGLQLLQMLLEESLEGERAIRFNKYTMMMKQNCRRLLRLISNLIDISKIESGYFDICLRNCNVVSVVEDITLSVADYVENHLLELEFDTDVEEKIIACDTEKIERIILNLLSNAVKFTPAGGKITVTILDLGEKVEIRVKDTGVGIPEDKMDLLFQRFKQINKSLVKDNQGSGIGLSLVRYLVELHSGTIRVESEYGNGSEFIITLPAKTVEENLCENEENLSSQSKLEIIDIEFSDIFSI